MERKRKIDLDNNNAVATNDTMNPWTNKPYSQKYFEILEKRKQLPVWEQKEDFFEIMEKNQVMVLVGETGSGKTTQVRLIP